MGNVSIFYFPVSKEINVNFKYLLFSGRYSVAFHRLLRNFTYISSETEKVEEDEKEKKTRRRTLPNNATKR